LSDISLLICFFFLLFKENDETSSESCSIISSDTNGVEKCEVDSQSKDASLPHESRDMEVRLLDLYSGCGAMSTGLCLGGHLSGVNLVTVSSLFVFTNTIL